MDSPGVGTIRMMVCEGPVCNPRLSELDAMIPRPEGRLCGGTKGIFDVVAPVSDELAKQLRTLVHTSHSYTHAAYVDNRWTCSVCHHSRR